MKQSYIKFHLNKIIFLKTYKKFQKKRFVNQVFSNSYQAVN